MSGAPIAGYDGNVAGYQATKPGLDQKIDPLNADVMNYGAYLKNSHIEAMKSVGASNMIYSYRYSFNGFAAEMTAVQAEKLKSNPNVLVVTKDEMVTVIPPPPRPSWASAVLPASGRPPAQPVRMSSSASSTWAFGERASASETPTCKTAATIHSVAGLARASWARCGLPATATIS